MNRVLLAVLRDFYFAILRRAIFFEWLACVFIAIGSLMTAEYVVGFKFNPQPILWTAWYPALQLVAGILAITTRRAIVFEVLSAVSYGAWSQVRSGVFVESGEAARKCGIVAVVTGSIALIILTVCFSLDRAVPAMTIRGTDGSVIEDYGKPSPHNGTNFGVVKVGSPAITHTFSLEDAEERPNTGLAPAETRLGVLKISNISVDATTSGFSVTAPPSLSVSPGATTAFDVTYRPLISGVETTDIVIVNNTNGNHRVFHLRVTGEGAEFVLPSAGQEAMPTARLFFGARLHQ